MNRSEWEELWEKEFYERTTLSNLVLTLFDNAGSERWQENYLYKLKHQVENEVGYYVSMDDCAKILRDYGFNTKYIKSNKYLDGYTWKISRKKK